MLMSRLFSLLTIFFGLIFLIILQESVVFAATGEESVSGEIYQPPPLSALEQAQLESQQQLKSGNLTQAKTISLESPSSAEKAQFRRSSEEDQDTSKPLQIGIGREVSALWSALATMSNLTWQAVPDGGRAAVLLVTSPGASAIRLGVRIEQLPAEAEFRFYSGKGMPVHYIPGKEILETIERNEAAGDHSEAAEIYWSPTIEGDTAGLEIYLPGGVAPESVLISIPLVSHLYVSPFGASSAPEKAMARLPALPHPQVAELALEPIGQSDPRNLNFMCYNAQSDIDYLGRATAEMVLIHSGDPYYCTGTLLNDRNQESWAPWFITARHCISDQTMASSLETFWFYNATDCSHPDTRSSSMRQLIGGATLHFVSPNYHIYQDAGNAVSNTDIAFLRLNQTPPSGVGYSGWDPNTGVVKDNSMVVVHHPMGDLKKITFVFGRDYARCYQKDSQDNSGCETPDYNGGFINVSLSAGCLEKGSSGSGLFAYNSYFDEYLLVGVDSSAIARCSGDSGVAAWLGLFGRAYAVGQLGLYMSPLNEAVDTYWLGWFDTGNTGLNGCVADPSWHCPGEWYWQNTTTHDGVDAAQSGAISHNQQSWMKATVFLDGPRTLSFWWKVSSEINFDWLRFYIDDVHQIGRSGIGDWWQMSYNLSSGTHRLLWTYTKDGSASAGSDAGWVDQVRFYAVPGSVSVSPSSGYWTASPQNLGVSSNGATTIYYTMVNTYDGSTPADPTIPSSSSNNGSLDTPSGWGTFQFYAYSGELKKTKLRFVGCNLAGCGPASGVYSYTLDLQHGNKADFDGDGRADILWRHAISGQNWMYRMNGNSILDNNAINTVSDLNWKIAGVGDFDGDSRADILWRHAVSGQNWMYRMNGNSILDNNAINTVANLDWKIVGIGDFDGDGKADILWRNSATGENWLYRMNGNSIQGSNPIDTVSNLNWKIVGVADFDGDGKADILWRNSSTGENWLYRMNGNSIQGSNPINTVSNLDWKIVGVADFDGDGKADILWRNSATGENWLYRMNGNSIQGSNPINTVSNLDWKIVLVSDFDGDGKADILWRNSATGENWLYRMNGNSIQGSQPVNTVADLNWQIQGGGGN